MCPLQSPRPFAPRGSRRSTTALLGPISPSASPWGPQHLPALHTTKLTFDLWWRDPGKDGASACQCTVALGVGEFQVMSEWRVCTRVYDLRKDLVSVRYFELFFFFSLLLPLNDKGVFGGACRRYGNTEEAECELLWRRFSSFRGWKCVTRSFITGDKV